MAEMFFLILAGALSPVALLLGLWMVFTILNFRDSRRDTFKFVGGAGKMGFTMDISKHPVKIKKIHNGFRIVFLDQDGETVYSATLDKVDDPPED